MAFIYGGDACGMGIYYKSHSVLHIPQLKVYPQYVLNIQFCGLMTFIYGGAARGMGISSEKGTKKPKRNKRNRNKQKRCKSPTLFGKGRF